MSAIKSIIKCLDDKSAQDIVVMDLRQVSPFMDYMVVASVSNTRLLHSLATYVMEELEKNNIIYSPMEGNQNSDWLLIDGKEMVISLFLESSRNIYQLERLWGDYIVDINALE